MIKNINGLALTILFLWLSSVGAFAQSLVERVYENFPEREQLLIQLNLKTLGYYGSNVDGIWGPSMEAAIADVISLSTQGGSFYDVSNQSSVRAMFDDILNSGEGEGWECDGCQTGNEAPPVSTNNGLPNWLNVPTLSYQASISDWAGASESTRLASAAQYYVSYISSDSQVQRLVQSGALKNIAQEIMGCMNEIIVFGLQTNQKRQTDPVYPDIAGGCLFIVQSN